MRILARHPAVTLTAAMSSGATSAPRPLPALTRIWDGTVTPLDVDQLVGVGRHRVPRAARGRLGRARAEAARARPARHRPVGRLPDPRRRRSAAVVSGHGGAAGRHRLRLDRGPSDVDRGRAAGLEPRLLSDGGAARARAAGRAGLLDGTVVVDAKSGISGAGKAPTDRTHFSENHGSVAAYGVFSHRHTAEIEQELGMPVTFVPHLVPLDRGILETIYAPLTPGTTAAQVAEALQSAYADAPFVRLTGGDAAGDQARRAHQLLRHRLEGGRSAAARRARVGDRQSGEGRRRLGGAEPQRAARPRRAHGPAVTARRSRTPKRGAAGAASCSSSAASCSSSRRTCSGRPRHRARSPRTAPLVVVHGGGKEIDAALAPPGSRSGRSTACASPTPPTLDVGRRGAGRRRSTRASSPRCGAPAATPSA